MKEHPILFSGEMVRSILAGTKTQTRRVAKPQPKTGGPVELLDALRAMRTPWFPGLRLWVRETWQPLWADADHAPPYGLTSPEGWALGYPATDGVQEWEDEEGKLTMRCKPAIHMPRWASRITLEITGVRAERIQDISEEDARAEGCEASELVTLKDGSPCFTAPFQKLWTSLHGIDNPKAWYSNPWAWALTFKRIEKSASEVAA